MLTDRQNRLMLIVSLGIYASLMALMALASTATPVGGGLGVFLAFVIWPMIMLSFIAAIAWLADGPLIRRWYAEGSGPHQFLASILFFVGILALGLGLFAGWCSESTATYVALAILTGAAGTHQYALYVRENLPPEAMPLSRARLVI